MHLDWSKQGREYYVIDIEADSLYPSVIYVMCWKKLPSGETGAEIGHDAIKAFFDSRSSAVFVGHNLLKFDAYHLRRLLDIRIDESNCVDTLVLSTLYSPSLDGGHSLDAWGQRLGKPKIDFHDWGRLSDEMITYCHMDVAITAELFIRLTKTLVNINFSERSVWLQHHLTAILDRQHRNGFYFDGPRALSLYQSLRQREDDIATEVRKAFPAKRVKVAERQLYTKDGRPTAIYLRDAERYIIDENYKEGTYTAYEDVEFSIGSPKQRIEKLMQLGWEPEEFTEKGSPKPFDKGKMSPSLERFLEDNPMPEVEYIAKWMAVNGRANMINTWLENWNERDSCIHGKLFVADTLRFRHQSPNTANIPAVRVSKDGTVLRGMDGFYTYEARDLWTARPNRLLVGTDAAGLELRMLAHYLNRPDFTKQVVEGDPHQYNADVVGITRPQAKTLIYAIMYGAAAPKIAKTLGVTIREGAHIRNMFLERLGLKELIEECQHEQSQGRVELIDGSQVVCPSPHAALNYKLQGGGARVMGLALVLLDRHVRQHNLDALFVGNIHDEIQTDVCPDHADLYGIASVECLEKAGILLKMNVPITGEYKKGRTWSQTH